MKALKFNLSGKTAFFKKPDVNTYLYFTYGCIHKIAVLGILGSVLGLEGYNQQEDKEYPDFYAELSALKIAIVPKNSRGYIPKKVQIFNNSVGYASQEEGGNLIVKEQWLESPSWDMYICLEENVCGEAIEKNFLNRSFKYVPYLGKNDHFADIKAVQIISMEEAKDFSRVDSLFLKKHFEFLPEVQEEVGLFTELPEDKWKYEEKLPISLQELTNQYITESFVFTNMRVGLKEPYKLYTYEDKVVFFF
ncbi:type I-B CRISPR-associated protein Cas5 [Clostridium sp. 19966]|uniref:type I-B CRISPR-associated protein Cas5b n=1 Tax=Clostridium sp. 19966 TaxID=2768166 RepID=UPI0028DF374D|nr:type I-B CRISPR-associated protein Cas5b [Clostridium sp. 19966]MDT8719413.1 type I-B CRISPR-associated protein Cas5 [Clostridium sp. 19966]